MEERLLYIQMAGGSNPSGSTKKLTGVMLSPVSNQERESKLSEVTKDPEEKPEDTQEQPEEETPETEDEGEEGEEKQP